MAPFAGGSLPPTGKLAAPTGHVMPMPCHAMPGKEAVSTSVYAGQAPATL